MTLRKTKTVNFTDDKINRMQDNIITNLDQLRNLEILDGILLEGLALTSGDNNINHGLGRSIRGWIVVRVRASATFYDKQDSTSSDTSRILVLNASAPVTIDLWVF